MPTTELTGRNSGFRFAENTEDLFVGKTPRDAVGSNGAGWDQR